MSDTRTLSSNSNKRSIDEIDGKIEILSHEIQHLEDFVSRCQLECSLMTVKLKREKVKALSAVAKSKALVADMEVMIAESDLLFDIERLTNCKKIKLDCGAGKSQPSGSRPSESQEKSKSASKTVAVQTSKSSHAKKKRKHSTSPKTPINNSSDETILISSLQDATTSNTETLVTQFNIDLIKKSAETNNKSDSETSLSSSIKEEFDKPYTKADAEKSEKKTKGKSDKKNTSKNKNNSLPTQSPNTDKPRTVAELKCKSVEQINRSGTSTPSTTTVVKTSNQHSHERTPIPSTSTYVPIRHSMPQIMTQGQGLYLPRPNLVPQSNITYSNDTRNGMIVQNHPFYGNK